MSDKNNFILYKDFKSTIDILTDEQAGKLIKAVFGYVNGRVDPNFTDGMLIVAFNILKTQLERDLDKYKGVVERNRKNGLLGGRPKKENPDVIDKPNKPSGLSKTQVVNKKPKKADSDSDSVRDSESVNESVSKKDGKNSTKKKTFIPPTLEQIKDYCKSRNNNVDAKRFYDYFTVSNWVDRNGNQVMNWKQKVITWENNNKDEKPKVEEKRYKGATYV